MRCFNVLVVRGQITFAKRYFPAKTWKLKRVYISMYPGGNISLQKVFPGRRCVVWVDEDGSAWIDVLHGPRSIQAIRCCSGLYVGCSRKYFDERDETCMLSTFVP